MATAEEIQELNEEADDLLQRLAAMREGLKNSEEDLAPTPQGLYVVGYLQGAFKRASQTMPPVVARLKVVLGLLEEAGVTKEIPPKMQWYLKYRH